MRFLTAPKKRDRKPRKDLLNRIPKGESAVKLLIFLALTAAVTYLYPSRQSYEYTAFREGTIAPDEIIAPETFYVLKDQETYLRDVAIARKNVLPVVQLKEGMLEQKQQQLASFFTDVQLQISDVVPDSLLQSLRQTHAAVSPLSESSLRTLISLAQQNPETLSRITQTVNALLAQAYSVGLITNKADLIASGYRQVHLTQ